jgi:hypothetical protein
MHPLLRSAVTVPKYEKTTAEKSGESYTLRGYRLGDLEKRTFVFETTGLFGSGSFGFYAKSGIVFARKIVSADPYLRKGVKMENDPEGTIGERNWYFRNENEGISERRSIDYFANSNKDSLRIVLQQQPFETDSIGHEEYLQVKQGYERSKTRRSRKD